MSAFWIRHSVGIAVSAGVLFGCRTPELSESHTASAESSGTQFHDKAMYLCDSQAGSQVPWLIVTTELNVDNQPFLAVNYQSNPQKLPFLYDQSANQVVEQDGISYASFDGENTAHERTTFLLDPAIATSSRGSAKVIQANGASQSFTCQTYDAKALVTRPAHGTSYDLNCKCRMQNGNTDQCYFNFTTARLTINENLALVTWKATESDPSPTEILYQFDSSYRPSSSGSNQNFLRYTVKTAAKDPGEGTWAAVLFHKELTSGGGPLSGGTGGTFKLPGSGFSYANYVCLR